MKIGIFSGTFDPFTNGHQWIVEEGLRLFDHMHVLVGSHPRKKPAFSQEERLEMVKNSIFNPRITYGILRTNVVVYALGVKKPQDDVYIMRGIRDGGDFEYELSIQQQVQRISDQVHTIFVMPPAELSDVRSTYIKKRCEVKNWRAIEKQVPEPVLDKLRIRYGGDFPPPVSSIFETTTAGFGPVGGWKSVMADYDPILYDPLEKSKNFFYSLHENGLIKFTEKISGDQVRNMLDPIHFDIVCSDTFELKTIDIDSVEPTGDRWLAQSQSFGPIIVDVNDTGERPDLGRHIVIEGKHRLLDAKDRGDKRIMAWVGDKVILTT